MSSPRANALSIRARSPPAYAPTAQATLRRHRAPESQDARKKGVPGNVPESAGLRMPPPGLGMKTTSRIECPAHFLSAVLREDVQFFQVKAVAERLPQGKTDGRRVGASDPKKACALRGPRSSRVESDTTAAWPWPVRSRTCAGAALRSPEGVGTSWARPGLSRGPGVTLSAALKGPRYGNQTRPRTTRISSQPAAVRHARSALRPPDRSPRAAASTAPACRARR